MTESNFEIAPETLMHPEDPSVMVTDIPEVFRNPEYSTIFQARILQRSSEEKLALHQLFREIHGPLNRKKDDAEMFLVHEDGALKEFLPTPEILKNVQDELLTMADYYMSLSGEEAIEVACTTRPIGPTKHSHDYPVLNANHLCLGTSWRNKAGKLLTVDQGDMFYFEAGFDHESTITARNESRLLAYCVPMDAV